MKRFFSLILSQPINKYIEFVFECFKINCAYFSFFFSNFSGEANWVIK